MNKFGALVILGLVAIVSAFDEDEVAAESNRLTGHAKLFTHFCLRQRFDIIKDFQKKLSQKLNSDDFYNAFLGEEFDQKVGDRSVEVIKQIIKNQKGNDEPVTDLEVRRYLAEGIIDITKDNEDKKFLGFTLFSTANVELFKRLSQLASKFKPTQLFKGIGDACNQVAEYKTQLESKLKEEKEILKTETSDAEAKAFIDAVSVSTLNCRVTSWMSRTDTFCGLFRNNPLSSWFSKGLAATNNES